MVRDTMNEHRRLVAPFPPNLRIVKCDNPDADNLALMNHFPLATFGDFSFDDAPVNLWPLRHVFRCLERCRRIVEGKNLADIVRTALRDFHVITSIEQSVGGRTPSTSHRLITFARHCALGPSRLFSRKPDAFFAEKFSFCFYPTRSTVTAQTAVCSDYSMAGYFRKVGVLRAGIRHGTRRIGVSNLARYLGIGPHLASRYVHQCLPDFDLKNRATQCRLF